MYAGSTTGGSTAHGIEMKSFRNLSIKSKLLVIILSITIFSLVTGFAIVMVYDIHKTKGEMVDTTVLMAKAVGEYSVGDLAFGDREEAERTLGTLDNIPNIQGACLFDAEGSLFASYTKPGAPQVHPETAPTSAEFGEGSLHVFQEIVYRGEAYGTIYLSASLKPLNDRIRNHLAAGISLLAVLVLISVLIALRLQRFISKPILRLTRTARKISEEGDYSIRVRKTGDDETGVLCDSFNDMLQQIELRKQERIRIEDALRESEEKYRALFEQSSDVIYITSEDGRFLDINDPALVLHGYTREELLSMNARDLYFHREDRRRFQAAIEADGFVRDLEVKLKTKDGKPMDGLLNSTVRKDKEGNVIGYQGTIRDVTEKKVVEQELNAYREFLEELVESRSAEIMEANVKMENDIEQLRLAEHELRASEEKYRELINTMADGVASMDSEGTIIHWNPGAARIWGYAEEDILGKSVLKLIPRRFHATWAKYLKDLQSSKLETLAPRTREIVALRWDGKEFPIEISHSVRRKGDGWIATSISRDITERKNAEMRVKQSEERLKTILNKIPVGTAIIDPESHVISDVNPMAVQMIGLTKGEIVGKVCHRFICSHDEGDCPITDRGEEIHMSERTLLNAEGEAKIILKTVDSITLDQKEYLMECFVDVTEMKRVEEQLKKTTGELQATNEELEQFAYIASHDLKEPLRGVETFSQFLMEDYSDQIDDEGKDYLKRISAGTARMRNLIDDLLVLSRLARIKNPFESVDSGKLVEEAAKRLRTLIEEKNVEVDVDDELPFVYCDPIKIKEVFYNLINNAIKYNDKPNPRITVKAELYREANLPAAMNSPMRLVCFTVRDNGIGIKEEHHELVFQIFKRLHARNEFGGGTGAGLAIVKKIIEEHKGRIWVESEEGKGTAFSFTLPKKEEPS